MASRLKQFMQVRHLIGLFVVLGIGITGNTILGSSNAQSPFSATSANRTAGKASVLRPYSLGTIPYQYVAYSGSVDQTRLQTGIKNYFAAFIVSSSPCTPSWGGSPVNVIGSERSNILKQDFANLKAAGGDVVISFGGANGIDLATSCTSSSDLVEAYRSIINTYGITKFDFDIEGPTLGDDAGNARRVAAVKSLQKEIPELQIWLTLPVHTNGLTDDGLSVIRALRGAEVTISGINIMTMNYNINSKNLGEQAIVSASKTYGQLQALFPQNSRSDIWKSLGITVMIGRNDTAPETLTLEDAQKIRAFAADKGVGLLSQWNVGRDAACQSETPMTQPRIDCSGVTQTPFEYLKSLTINPNNN